jgi:hypothetical protein
MKKIFVFVLILISGCGKKYPEKCPVCGEKVVIIERESGYMYRGGIKAGCSKCRWVWNGYND